MDLAPAVSIAPIRLMEPERGEDIQLRVTAPVDGDSLPVIVFSHGNGQSHHADGPLVNDWAADGFAVINPTHLDSRMRRSRRTTPAGPISGIIESRTEFASSTGTASRWPGAAAGATCYRWWIGRRGKATPSSRLTHLAGEARLPSMNGHSRASASPR